MSGAHMLVEAQRVLALVVVCGTAFVTAFADAAHARGAATAVEALRVQPPGRIDSHHSQDIDGDGKDDLIIVSGGEMRVHVSPLQATATLVASLPADSALWDLGDIDGDGALELVTIDGQGARAFEFELNSGKLVEWAQPLIQQRTIFRGGRVMSPSRRALLIDMRGNGRLDCLIPEARQVWIYAGDGAGHFASPQVLRFAADGDVELERAWQQATGQDPSASYRATARVPRFVVGNLGAADSGHDLIVVADDDLQLYQRHADGTLPAVHSGVFKAPDPPRDERNRRRIMSLPVMVGDVNADAISDLIVCDSGGGTVSIHPGASISGGGAPWAEKPAAIVRVKGWLVGARLADLDGDKRDDLLLVRIDEMSIWDALNVVTSLRLPVELAVYLARGDELFRDRAALTEAADIPLRIGGEGIDSIKVEAAFTPTAGGDHDGDGVKDLVLMAGRETLRIVGGKPGSDSWQELTTIKVSGMEEYKTVEAAAADFDGDGKDELVLVCRGWEGEGAARDEIRIIPVKR